MDAPLKGIRIIDWTIWQQGPVATAMLADMGAEVIKIEECEKGDPGRGIMSMGGASATAKGVNYYFEANNRHKQSLTLNLSKPEAREIVYKLAEKSDVFVQNFRKGVAGRLGLGYSDLKARNPKIIYANSTGYGPTGPDSGEPSFDYMAQARSGIMNIASVPEGFEPVYLNGGIADQMGAIMLAYGVMTALVARERYGVGQEVNASHLGSMIALQGLNVTMRTMLGKEFPRNTRDDAFNPLWNHYQCGDGKWICLGMLQTDRYWKDFCVALGLNELVDDERFNSIRTRAKNHRELVATLDKTFKTKSREEWMKILKEGGDFIYTVVNSINNLPDDPQVVANEYIVDYEHPEIGKTKIVGVPVILSQTPGDPRGRAPQLGENTELILTEMLGYSWDDIAKLRDGGVI